MSSLRPENRALFEAARQTFEPSDDDRARIGKMLGVPLGVAASLAATTASTTAAAGTVAAGTAVTGTTASATALGLSAGVAVAKWIAVVATVAAVGGGGAALYLSEQPSSHAVAPGIVASPVASAHASQANPTGTSSLFPASRGPSRGPAGEIRSVAPDPLPATPAKVSTETGGATATVPLVAPGNTADTAKPTVSVVEEARLLREADTALRMGDAARATALLDEHARTFPNGILAEERDAERVLLLCASGRAEARAEAQRFLTVHPESPLSERVLASCAAP
jgi:hypothetical protein